MASNLRPISDPLVNAAMLGFMIAYVDLVAPRRPAGMSKPRYDILCAIRRAGPRGIDFQTLVDQTGLKAGFVLEHLRSLRLKGLVAFERTMLTEKGRALLDLELRDQPHQPSINQPIVHADSSPPAQDEPAVADPHTAAAEAAPERPISAPESVDPSFNRLELIRRAAARIDSRRKQAGRMPLVVAQAQAKPARSHSPDWIARRMDRLRGATAFLKSRCIIVQVVNKDALVREYVMSGSFHRCTAEQVIARAERLGWEADA